MILNAQKVFAIIRNFPDCDITFAADEKNLVTISGGMSEFTVPVSYTHLGNCQCFLLLLYTVIYQP